jgi:ketosteroid isomerase-like protein
MSEENVEIVRRVVTELNRGGPAAVEDTGLLSDEVVYDGTQTGIPGVGIFRGIDSVVGFFERDWLAVFPFEEWEIHMEEATDSRDQVIFTSHQRGRGASSGAGTELTLGNIFTIRNGQIVRMQIFRPPDKALKAAGLSE